MRLLALACLALFGVACASRNGTPAIVQSVEFLRGCWVARESPDGPVTGFLRLLPPEPSAPAYSGASQSVMGAMVRDRFRFSFARDGARASIGYPDGTTEAFAASPSRQTGSAPQRAEYASPPQDGADSVLVAEGDDESLTIFSVAAISGRRDVLFAGRRDGCD